MQTYDTHAHLDQLKNLDEALKNADQAGVKGIVAVSMNLESCKELMRIKAGTHKPKIYIGMGIHPGDAELEQLWPCVELIRQNVDELTVIGEIGLDFWYKWVRKDQEKKDIQKKVFQQFLILAKELNLPAVIHARGTWEECFEMAKEMGPAKCEFHWYSGPIDVLKNILDQGYYVSTSPSVAYSPQSREAMAFAPIEQTLIETDSPVYYKNGSTDEEGFQAEPKDIFRTLEAYCALKNIEEEKAVEILNHNARTFFNLS